MWLSAKRPLQRPQPHEVNQVQLFGPLFHQEALHTTKCGGNHFYHWIHTQANGDLAHSACDPRSTSQMSAYVPCVFHKLQEFIWIQLGSRYIVKQIYDKHKKIWWARANVGE
jgi:hypothetical protein